jgi:hypothetical protein
MKALREGRVMYRKPNTVTTLKIRRLKWAGHLVRMLYDRMIKYFSGNQTQEEKREDQN